MGPAIQDQKVRSYKRLQEDSFKYIGHELAYYMLVCKISLGFDLWI